MTSPPSPDIQVLGNCALEIDFQSGQVDFQGGQVDFQSGQVVRPETQHTSPGGGGGFNESCTQSLYPMVTPLIAALVISPPLLISPEATEGPPSLMARNDKPPREKVHAQ